MKLTQVASEQEVGLHNNKQQMTLRWRVGKQLNFQKAFLARENQCFFHDADFEVDKNINKTNRYTVSYR